MSGDAGVSAKRDSADPSILPPATTREPMRERPVESEGETRPIEPFFPDSESHARLGADNPGSAGTGGRAPAPDSGAAPGPGGGGAGSSKPLIELTDIVDEGGSTSTPGLQDDDSADPDMSARALAERLEALAARLRRDGATALDADPRKGDRLDTLLNGLLAGYLAAD